LAEAVRAGFTAAVIPESTPKEAVPPGLHAFRVRTLMQAIGVAIIPEEAGTMPSWLTVAASR
jgi:hypothetical protein